MIKFNIFNLVTFVLNASVFSPHIHKNIQELFFHLTKCHDKQKENRNAEDLLFGIMANSDTHNCVEVEAVTM